MDGKEDNVLNATIGVPIDILVPLLLTGQEKTACYNTFAICTNATVNMADKIVSLVKKNSTMSAYKVRGGIQEDDKGEFLVDQKIGWTIRKTYKRFLVKIQKTYKMMGVYIPLDQIIQLDQSFRIKRCRRSTIVVDEYGTSRTLVWYQYIPIDKNYPLHAEIGQWFDISLSKEPVRSSRLESLDDLKTKQRRFDQLTSRQCTACGRRDTLSSPFQACGHCCKTHSPTYYCSRICQKNNWSKHKVFCIQDN